MPFKPGQSGNPKGKPRGAKGKKTEQWEALADSITGEQSQRFSEYMENLWNDHGKSDDQARKDKEVAAELYLKTLEYFKPKQSRVEASVEGEQEIIVRVIREYYKAQ